ncbi:MAG: hypothetical protein U9Q85_03480 [Patescibacteria group bacterium]|nr:hypothetical protein [Patescibacteria group bacterium]
MAKKIKQQIKKSMPLFIIMCMLLTSTAIGVVFSYNLEIGSWHDVFFGINISHPEAKAQTGDTATTEVTVRNAPPVFSVDAREVPASTSTSPINNGSTLDFEGDATDPENNDYYLIVCETVGVTASSTGGAPSCTGTELCVSTSTLISNTASCTATVSDAEETQDWYAYVCDTHATEGECSVDYSQGASPGDYASSSPFYINHAPVFASVSTTDDDKDPGSNYTVTASVEDDDVVVSQDELTLYICGSNVWTTGGGCTGQEFCQSTSTSADIACTWATTTPAVDDTFLYWAFVKDEHDFAATSTRTNTYTVNNVAPQVSSVRVHGSVDFTLNIKGASEILATTTATITDNNTCGDIDDATSSIYYSAVTNEHNCDPDDDDCYQIGVASCMIEAGSCVGTSTQATAICSTTLAFHTSPTDNSTSNPYETGNWLAGIKGIDDDGAIGVATTTGSYGVEVNTSLALTVQEAGIDYLSVTGGTNTGLVNATTTIENYGNSPLNSQFSGEDLIQTGVDYIETTEQRFGTSSATYLSLAYPMPASSTSEVHDVTIVKPDDDTSLTITDEVYWGINIPSGKPSGVYSGLNTFMAALDSSDW